MTRRWLTKVADDPFGVVVVFYILAFAMLMWGIGAALVTGYLTGTAILVGYLWTRAGKKPKP